MGASLIISYPAWEQMKASFGSWSLPIEREKKTCSGAINTISVLQGEPSIYSGMNELSLQIEEHAFSMLTNAAPIIDRVQII